MKKKEYIIPMCHVKMVAYENCLLVGSPLDPLSDTPSTDPDPDPFGGKFSAKEMIDFILGQAN